MPRITANLEKEVPEQPVPPLSDTERDRLEPSEANIRRSAPVTKENGNRIELSMVIIDRNSATKIADWVPSYEVPVLEAIHGEDYVYVDSTRDGYTSLNAQGAWSQMLNKYRQEKDQVKVKAVYPTPKSLARATGLPWSEGDNKRAKQQASLVIDHSEHGDVRYTGATQGSAAATTPRGDSAGSGD